MAWPLGQKGSYEQQRDKGKGGADRCPPRPSCCSSSSVCGQRFTFPLSPPDFLEEATGEESSLGFLKARRVKLGSTEIRGNTINGMHMCTKERDHTGSLLTDQNRNSLPELPWPWSLHLIYNYDGLCNWPVPIERKFYENKDFICTTPEPGVRKGSGCNC